MMPSTYDNDNNYFACLLHVCSYYDGVITGIDTTEKWPLKCSRENGRNWPLGRNKFDAADTEDPCVVRINRNVISLFGNRRFHDARLQPRTKIFCNKANKINTKRSHREEEHGARDRGKQTMEQGGGSGLERSFTSTGIFEARDLCKLIQTRV